MNEVQKKAISSTIQELYRGSSVDFQSHATKVLEGFVEAHNRGSAIRPVQMSFLNRTAWDTYNRHLRDMKL